MSTPMRERWGVISPECTRRAGGVKAARVAMPSVVGHSGLGRACQFGSTSRPPSEAPADCLAGLHLSLPPCDGRQRLSVLYRFLGIGALLPPRYAGAWTVPGEATSRATWRRACSTGLSGSTWMSSCAPPPTGPMGRPARVHRAGVSRVPDLRGAGPRVCPRAQRALCI